MVGRRGDGLLGSSTERLPGHAGMELAKVKLAEKWKRACYWK